MPGFAWHHLLWKFPTLQADWLCDKIEYIIVENYVVFLEEIGNTWEMVYRREMRLLLKYGDDDSDKGCHKDLCRQGQCGGGLKGD